MSDTKEDSLLTYGQQNSKNSTTLPAKALITTDSVLK